MKTYVTYHAYKKNQPIALIIEDYVNKRSGKVVESRKEIRHRFAFLDWTDQKKILVLFLNSGKLDREWAYTVLLEIWDNDFKPIIEKLWKQYHEDKCAWVIIRHFPINYLKENMESLAKDRNYYFICKRIGHDNKVNIDRERISESDYLALLNELGETIDTDEGLDIMFRMVHDLCVKPLDYSKTPFVEHNQPISSMDFPVIRKGLFHLQNMGCHLAVEEFEQWDKNAKDCLIESPEFRELCNTNVDDANYRILVTGLCLICLYTSLDDKHKRSDDPPIEAMKKPISYYKTIDYSMENPPF